MYVCLFAIHYVSFKPVAATLGSMVEYHPEHVIAYIWYQVSNCDCHA